MMENSVDNRNCSDKRLEGANGLKTVECLRGRLLAERQASRIAKENAEKMGNKLIELENVLKEEIKLRNKAEKKLKKLKKKLESLNISSILVESDQSSSSEKSEVSCGSSTITSTSCPNDSEENEFDLQVTDSVTSQESNHNVLETSTAMKNHEILSNEEILKIQSFNSLVKYPCSEDFCDNPSHKIEDSKTGENSSADLKSSAVDNEIDHEDYVDNALALVAVSLPVAIASKTSELKPVHENVAEVLDSLRYIREKIQSSMDLRRMLRVGPS